MDEILSEGIVHIVGSIQEPMSEVNLSDVGQNILNTLLSFGRLK